MLKVLLVGRHPSQPWEAAVKSQGDVEWEEFKAVLWAVNWWLPIATLRKVEFSQYTKTGFVLDAFTDNGVKFGYLVVDLL